MSDVRIRFARPTFISTNTRPATSGGQNGGRNWCFFQSAVHRPPSPKEYQDRLRSVNGLKVKARAKARSGLILHALEPREGGEIKQTKPPQRMASMSEQPLPASDSVSPSVVQRIDEVCDRFETAWKAGQRPQIENYLDDVAEPDCSLLLRELLGVELTYRRQSYVLIAV
jgi:hypothetical protein